MTSRHTIVVRQSPDWMNFDLSTSVAFMRERNLPENLIIDFVALWDAEFSLTYRELRAALKVIAAENHSKVRHASVTTLSDFDIESVDPEDRIIFVDDDDWFSEHLVTYLPPFAGEDGIYWDLVRLGKRFSSKESLNAPGWVSRYPSGKHIWTNNYAVSGRALRCLGLKALQEHGSAHHSFHGNNFIAAEVDKTLACTVKHPCATMSVKHHMKLPEFRSHPRLAVEQYVHGLREIELDDDLSWMRAELSALVKVLDQAIGL